MNCSLALLDAVAKYAFEMGLKPLKVEGEELRGRGKYLLDLAKLGFVVEQLERVKDVLHRDQGVIKVLASHKTQVRSSAIHLGLSPYKSHLLRLPFQI